ncbi:hypothetical protein HDV00_011339, partial [Rhizophlyctis rosea]
MVVKETRIPTGQAVANEDQTRWEREKYGQKLKRREETGKFASGGSRDSDVELYDREEEKPPWRSARLQGLPADESSESERETSEEEEESEPDQEVRMPVENEWGEDDGSVAVLKQSRVQMRDNTLRIPKPELEAAGRVGRPYFESSTADVAEMEMLPSEGGWQLCLIQEEYTPPYRDKYQRRSRGSKQLDWEDSGEGEKEFGRELKSAKSGTVKREEVESLRILRLHLERQGADVVNEEDVTPIDEWRDVDSATLQIATGNVNSLRK